MRTQESAPPMQPARPLLELDRTQESGLPALTLSSPDRPPRLEHRTQVSKLQVPTALQSLRTEPR